MILFSSCQIGKTAIDWLTGQLSGFPRESIPLCKMPLLVTAGAFFVLAPSRHNLFLSVSPGSIPETIVDMPRKLVQKSISMQAPAEVIWRIVTEAQYNVVWLAAFGKRHIAQTDWREGSKAIFIDDTQTGLVTRIREARPFEKIRMQNIGIITNGKEDYTSDDAVESREFFEQYHLTPENGAVVMRVEVTVEDEFYNEVSHCWANALETIKKLAESQATTAPRSSPTEP